MDLVDYEDFCHITSRKQLTIKGKENIVISVENKILKLSDILYIPGLTMNFISIISLWRNDIGVYFPASQLIEPSFNRTIFAYTDNVSD